MVQPGTDLADHFHRQEVRRPQRPGGGDVVRDAVQESPGEHVAGARQVLRLAGERRDVSLDELKARMPYADLSAFSANPEVEKIGDLYTVDMLVHYVQNKLSA